MEEGGSRGSELEREMCVVKGGSRGSRGSERERDVCGGGWLTWLKWLCIGERDVCGGG